jgi:hypothetical protein
MMPGANLRKEIAAALPGRLKRNRGVGGCPWRARGQQLQWKVLVIHRVERDDLPGQLGERFYTM